MQKKVNAITTEIQDFEEHPKADRSTPAEERYMCCIARQVTIPASLRAAVLATRSEAEIMSIETHRSVFKRQ